MQNLIHRCQSLRVLQAAGLVALGCGSHGASIVDNNQTGGNTADSSAQGRASGGASTALSGSTTRTSSTGAGATGFGGEHSTAGGATERLATGGANASGGVPAAGGASQSGGGLSLGGATATGGSVATGGALATGGTSATGGATARSSLSGDRVMTNCETPTLVVQTQRIEAECAFGATLGSCKGTIGGQQGTQLENDDTDVGYIEDGDFLFFDGIEMTGITTLKLHYSKGADGGSIELRLDGTTGQLIGTLTPTSTGSWTTWNDVSIALNASTGTHSLYFTFKGTSAGIISLDWFQVSAGISDDAPSFHMNQVGFDAQGAKHAVIEGPATLSRFQVVDSSGAAVWCGDLTPQTFDAWGSSKTFYSVDFTELTRPGSYRLQTGDFASGRFTIAENQIFNKTFAGVVDYFKTARADEADVWTADTTIPVIGSSTVVDARGGWYDASGDISKYLTHLSYANFMNPQQIPLVAWALGWVHDNGGTALTSVGNATQVQQEALWGADFLLRMLDPAGYFYTTVFDNWSGNLGQRQICAFSGQGGSVNEQYQSALREGGGMSIAALARIARWQADGSFKSSEYLQGAERAFAFLDTAGVQFADDGKENIIDDYTGLLAASELYETTEDPVYLDSARARADSLIARLGAIGYFIADGAARPFWHASDAGLPVVALVQYVKVETDALRRSRAREAIQTHLNYLLNVTRQVTNPYGYARQPISESASGFFIPHENESGYWWQGENARLGSLAAAALLGADALGASDTTSLDLLRFAGAQLDWILGANPYDLCFVQGFGSQNPPLFCSSKAQWQTQVGGIANGITGRESDGSGIQWTSGTGCWDDWRWVEQWLPHAAWYMVAITALTR